MRQNLGKSKAMPHAKWPKMSQNRAKAKAIAHAKW